MYATKLRSQAANLIVDFMNSDMKAARVIFARATSINGKYITMRKTIAQLDLQDKIKVHTRSNEVYLEKVESE